MAAPPIPVEFVGLLDTFRDAAKIAKTLSEYFAPADKRKAQLIETGNAAVCPGAIEFHHVH